MKEDIKYFIEDFREEDFKELQDFWVETGVGNPQRGDGPGIIRSSVEKGGKLLIVKLAEDSVIIGSAWITTDGRRTYLHYFAVAENYRRRGLAKILMDKVMEYAEKLGLQIRLEVHVTNEPAIQLYKKYGFRYLGDYDIYINREIQKSAKE